MNDMRYFIVDDDVAVRTMIAEIIEDNDLGIVVGEAFDASEADASTLNLKRVDILLIDRLMPLTDGLEAVKALENTFNGKIVMISQVTSKDMIGEAYAFGVEYYVTKPVNRLELIGVLTRVAKQVRLQKSITDIHKTLSNLSLGQNTQSIGQRSAAPASSITITGKYLLTELGAIGTTGSKDLLDLLSHLYELNARKPFGNEFPALKELFVGIALKKMGPSASEEELRKEIKASEQRVRRSICQALSHLASLGLTDYNHPRFEEFASTFFNFSEVRNRMLELNKDCKDTTSQSSINTKKFVKVLYLESLNRLNL